MFRLAFLLVALAAFASASRNNKKLKLVKSWKLNFYSSGSGNFPRWQNCRWPCSSSWWIPLPSLSPHCSQLPLLWCCNYFQSLDNYRCPLHHQPCPKLSSRHCWLSVVERWWSNSHFIENCRSSWIQLSFDCFRVSFFLIFSRISKVNWF